MTTDVQHTISDDLLMGYAAGALPQAFDLVVATHVSLSDDARARLESFEAVGGAVIEHVDEAELEEDSLAQTLAKISGMSPVQPKKPSEGVFPTPLQDVVGGDEDVVKWRSTAWARSNAYCSLTRMRPCGCCSFRRVRLCRSIVTAEQR